jgi:hypothetical protein
LNKSIISKTFLKVSGKKPHGNQLLLFTTRLLKAGKPHEFFSLFVKVRAVRLPAQAGGYFYQEPSRQG